MDVLTVDQVRNDLTDLAQELVRFSDTLLVRDPVQSFIDRLKVNIRILDAYIHGEEEDRKEEGQRKYGLFWRLLKRL